MGLKKSDRDWLDKNFMYESFVERRNELRAEGEDDEVAGIVALDEMRKEHKDSLREKRLSKKSKLLEVENLPHSSNPLEMVQWVGSSLSGVVDFKTCPGRDAYALFCDCLKDEKFRLDFWKNMFTKTMPNRSQLDDDDSVSEIDGSRTIAILDKIKRIAEKSSV